MIETVPIVPAIVVFPENYYCKHLSELFRREEKSPAPCGIRTHDLNNIGPQAFALPLWDALSGKKCPKKYDMSWKIVGSK